jgi:plastocyanin
MKTRFGATLVTLILGSSLAIGLSGASPSASATKRVAAAQSTAGPRLAIKEFRFSQPSLTVPVGTTVTWVNQDADAHTVTGASPPPAWTAVSSSRTSSPRPAPTPITALSTLT